MATSIRGLVRKLKRRYELTQPGIGQVIQQREQAKAQRRLLDQAEWLRETQCHREPTQMVPTVPMTPGQCTGHGTRSDW